ncbi:MAG: DUF881 domain-containing protein [Nocardioidaceae bacterium]
MPEQQRGNAWRRLRAALSARPSRAQLVVGVLVGALGFGAVVQVRSNDADDNYAGARRGDLVQLLDSLSAASDRLDQQLGDLTATRNKLRSNSQRNEIAEQEAKRDADNLAILAGTVPAKGPGVVITIQDKGKAVTASTLLNAIEELRDAGAEAMQINGVARVVAQTPFVDTDRGVRVGGRELTRPFVIEAIGSSATLRQAVLFRGGLIDQVENLGGELTAEERDEVEVTALAEPRDPEYAQAAS